jgi:murein DD-endopeptidase MepM/ murein hydrolase activator NlpD
VPLPASSLPEVPTPAPVPPNATSMDIDVKPALGPLLVPVAGVSAKDLADTFNQARPGERRHEALDIPAPKGTPVLAVADGKVAKLFNSKPGGLTVYQFDPSEKYAYYYAHLDSYAPELKEGMAIRRGQMVGYVGTTGNADPGTPHLHFAIFELGPDKKWWEGTAINPYPYLTGQAR